MEDGSGCSCDASSEALQWPGLFFSILGSVGDLNGGCG